MGIKRCRILRRFQKYKLILSKNAPKKAISDIRAIFALFTLFPNNGQLVWNSFLTVHFLTIKVYIFEIYVKSASFDTHEVHIAKKICLTLI
jgi:hypothetical protein